MSETNQADKTPGKFCWHEIMTKDPDGTKKFYTEMFGWTFEEMDMGNMVYTMFSNNGEPVCGMLAITEEMGPVQPNLLSYVTVGDIGAAVEKAKGLGGNVCKDVTELPMGKFAVVTDPSGVGFAFWEYSSAGC